MSIMPDHWIRETSQQQGMIESFVEKQLRRRGYLLRPCLLMVMMRACRMNS